MPTGIGSTFANRREAIHSGDGEGLWLVPGVRLRSFASKECGALGFSTGAAVFATGAHLAYHKHPVSEAITVLAGGARVTVEGRRYLLRPFDCIHVPAGIAHEVTSGPEGAGLVALSALASESSEHDFVAAHNLVEDRGESNPLPRDPEYIVRFGQAEIYELSEGALFRDVFRGGVGSVGICGGYGWFQPGASLPCHIHKYDESITIV